MELLKARPHDATYRTQQVLHDKVVSCGRAFRIIFFTNREKGTEYCSEPFHANLTKIRPGLYETQAFAGTTSKVTK